MDPHLPRHLVLSIFLFKVLKRNLNSQTTTLSACLSDKTEASFLSIRSKYASLPDNLPHRARSHLHTLFRRLHKSLCSCNRRFSSISRTYHHLGCSPIEVLLSSRRLRNFEKSLNRFDACVASIEDFFFQINRNYGSVTPGSSTAPSTPVNHSNAVTNRPPLSPADLTGVGRVLMTPIGEGGVIPAGEASRYREAERTPQILAGEVPWGGAVGLGQAEVDRRQGGLYVVARNRASGVAVHPNVPRRAVYAAGMVGRRVQEDMLGVTAAGTVGVYAVLLIFAVLVVGRNGGWVHSKPVWLDGS